MQMQNQQSCGANNVSTAASFYTNKYTKYGPNQLTPWFFSMQNIQFLQDTLNKILTNLCKVQVIVPFNDEVIQDMYSVIESNPGLSGLGEAGLQQLNTIFLEYETRIQYLSVRHQLLQKQYFLNQNTIKTMPIPPDDNVQKGEVVIDTSGYQLTHPFGKYHQDYLKTVYQIPNNIQAGAQINDPSVYSVTPL